MGSNPNGYLIEIRSPFSAVNAVSVNQYFKEPEALQLRNLAP